jgi:hypothetical protein
MKKPIVVVNVGGIVVVSDGVSLLDIKIASAKAWAMHHGMDYYSVAFGIESGDLAYKDAAIFMAQVYAHTQAKTRDDES